MPSANPSKMVTADPSRLEQFDGSSCPQGVDCSFTTTQIPPSSGTTSTEAANPTNPNKLLSINGYGSDQTAISSSAPADLSSADEDSFPATSASASSQSNPSPSKSNMTDGSVIPESALVKNVRQPIPSPGRQRKQNGSNPAATAATAGPVLLVYPINTRVPPPVWIERCWKLALMKANATARRHSSSSYPYYTAPDGNWYTTQASSWTSGFWPGILWQLYIHHKSKPGYEPILWKILARRWMPQLRGREKDSGVSHDQGFVYLPSFGLAYSVDRLPADKTQLMAAAAAQAARYSPTVGSIRSWDRAWGKNLQAMANGGPHFFVITDSMVSIEMLVWGAKNGGPQSWLTMATKHALNAAKDHVRPNGSTYHVVNYDPNTAKVISKGTYQGYAGNSTWARGQSWAIYGFSMMWREVKHPTFLKTARRVADWYLANLPKGDIIPYWDFSQAFPGAPRDSSSAAVAASGMLDLAKHELNAANKRKYMAAGYKLITALIDGGYIADGRAGQQHNAALLLHGTQFRLEGKFDTGIIYGDYYFLEALNRCTELSCWRSSQTVVATERG
eukprot:jgi/Chrzof1/6416/Cz18g09260.t1